MFLLILESLSFTELAIIGMIALMVLGPRRLPEMARKIGKIMAEFRKTTNEFKETWEREATIDPETKNLLQNPFLAEDEYSQETSQNQNKQENLLLAPEIKEVSAANFEALKEKAAAQNIEKQPEIIETSKQNWL